MESEGTVLISWAKSKIVALGPVSYCANGSIFLIRVRMAHEKVCFFFLLHLKPIENPGGYALNILYFKIVAGRLYYLFQKK